MERLPLCVQVRTLSSALCNSVSKVLYAGKRSVVIGSSPKISQGTNTHTHTHTHTDEWIVDQKVASKVLICGGSGFINVGESEHSKELQTGCCPPRQV